MPAHSLHRRCIPLYFESCEEVKDAKCEEEKKQSAHKQSTSARLRSVGRSHSNVADAPADDDQRRLDRHESDPKPALGLRHVLIQEQDDIKQKPSSTRHNADSMLFKKK